MFSPSFSQGIIIMAFFADGITKKAKMVEFKENQN